MKPPGRGHHLLSNFRLCLKSNSTPRFSLYLKSNSSLGKIGKLEISLFEHTGHVSVGNLDLSR
jgi:hypothetical protein